MSFTITRQLPTATDNVTYETVHPSVKRHAHLLPQLEANINKNPDIVCKLLPLETQMKDKWPYVSGTNPPKDAKITVKESDATPGLLTSFVHMILAKGKKLGQNALHGLTRTEVMKNESGEPVYEQTGLARHIEESPFGTLLGEWTDKHTP